MTDVCGNWASRVRRPNFSSPLPCPWPQLTGEMTCAQQPPRNMNSVSRVFGCATQYALQDPENVKNFFCFNVSSKIVGGAVARTSQLEPWTWAALPALLRSRHLEKRLQLIEASVKDNCKFHLKGGVWRSSRRGTSILCPNESPDHNLI